MKKVTLLIMLFSCALIFAQNESSGGIATTITTPSPISGETFRFGPGIVTQLDSGSGFGFTNDRWFSMGRLFTGSQNVYGLRFQLPNRAITLGYQDLNDTNPRIQWIGASSFSGTDLEFRAANSFTSTSSTLVATMTNDGKTFFGKPFTSTGSSTRVGVDYTDISSGSRTGVEVQNTSGSSGSATGFRSVNNVSCYVKTGLSISSSGGAYGDTGVSVSLRDGFYSSGVSAFVTANGGYTYGVSGRITLPSGVTSNSFGAGIYGNSAAVTNRFAGYFDGNVTVNGMFTSSDKKLKKEIETEENVLEKVMELDAVTYKFKANDQLNLPQELQHGFIAQNIEEVFPELVTTIKKPIIDKDNKMTGEYEYKAVNYIGLISVLTSSIQELNEKVATLENEKRENASKENLLEEVEGATFSMEQNVPNPFNSRATIRYTLPENAKANITIFDMTGKYIREYDLSNAKGQLVISSDEIGKGMFLYSLISGGEIIMTKKMIVK
ncbi:chaperone of endosialidase [Kordia sp. SMS9]|uniref:tail fiber domain-containing protein n=1 Tax=Kordia sp. SMS9 TaxID=2282170 RepID=UPI000E0DB20E|nr:tail fiber domain-containing protein [Kordia sp. SMS9]AXG72156.1 chaperone of endosialidase [Kordia sp. SMS9]